MLAFKLLLSCVAMLGVAYLVINSVKIEDAKPYFMIAFMWLFIIIPTLGIPIFALGMIWSY